MRIIRLLTNRSFLQILFALLLVTLLMFASNFIVLNNSVNSIYDQVKVNNKLIVTNIVESFDKAFRDINNLIYAINTQHYGSFSDNGSSNMAQFYDLQKDLLTYVNATNAGDYIEEVIVFPDRSELAVTTQGTINKTELFTKQYKHPVYNVAYWKSLANQTNPQRIYPADHYTEVLWNQGERRKKLLVVAGNNHVSNRSVFVMINYQKLLDHVGQSTMMQGSSLIVLDQSRNLILSTDQDWNLVELLRGVYLDDGGETTLKENNFEYNLYKSDYNGFTYIDKVPYQFANITEVGEANRLIMFSTIACAVLLSIVLSIYLFKPVRDIFKLLGGGYNRHADYRNIERDIVKMKQENESFRSQMGVVDKEIRKGMVLNVIDELPRSREFELRMQEYFADLFEKRYFMMASLQADPDQVDGGADVDHWRDEVSELLERQIKTQWPHAVYFRTGTMRYLLLIGLHQRSERAAILKDLRALTKDSVVARKDGSFLWAAVSGAYESKLDNWRPAYKDITDVMLYRNMSEEGPIFDVEAVRRTVHIYFPFDKIEKLSNSLVHGNKTDSIELVKEMIAENAARDIHFHQFANVAKMMFYQIVRHLPASQTSQQSFLDMEAAFVHKANYSFDYRVIQEELIGIVSYVSALGKQAPKTKMDPAFIAQYIEKHYMENLYLDHMAEIMETSPKYFSNYFKKTFNVNYVEYLNKVRLNHAREWLANSELSITEISEKTGYMNSSTFTTTFKKYYGISPSEYRKRGSTG